MLNISREKKIYKYKYIKIQKNGLNMKKKKNRKKCMLPSFKSNNLTL